jgi:DNA-binding PadR family transcriptional regulator
MKSINHIQLYPAGISLVADEIVEFHAARLILLIRLCGTKDRIRKLYKIEGLTKIAKLDFFIRYPEFFRKVVTFLDKQNEIQNHIGGVESRMIRYHYGPWDERYYQVLPYLESRGLIKIEKAGSTYIFLLTEIGSDVCENLLRDSDFSDLVKNIEDVQKILAKFTGSYLKDLIYKLFDKEVADRKIGEIIH